MSGTLGSLTFNSIKGQWCRLHGQKAGPEDALDDHVHLRYHFYHLQRHLTDMQKPATTKYNYSGYFLWKDHLSFLKSYFRGVERQTQDSFRFVLSQKIWMRWKTVRDIKDRFNNTTNWANIEKNISLPTHIHFLKTKNSNLLYSFFSLHKCVACNGFACLHLFVENNLYLQILFSVLGLCIHATCGLCHVGASLSSWGWSSHQTVQ